MNDEEQQLKRLRADVDCVNDEVLRLSEELAELRKTLKKARK